MALALGVSRRTVEIRGCRASLNTHGCVLETRISSRDGPTARRLGEQLTHGAV